MKGGAHLRDLAPEQSQKKRRSCGKPLETLRPILPGLESNPRSPAPIALFSTTTLTGGWRYFRNP